MADTTALKNRIRAAIKSNDNQEITGPVLQQALLDMVDELNGATETEAGQRQSADSTLSGMINSEVQRAQQAEGVADGHAQAALHQIENLEIEDVTGSQVQATEMSIALRTNEGSEQDPEFVTLDTLIIPQASEQKAGLMGANMLTRLINLENTVNGESLNNWVQGTVENGDHSGYPAGSILVIPTRISTSPAISIPVGTTITYNITSGYRLAIKQWDGVSELITTTSGWLTGSGSLVTTKELVFFTLSKSDDSAIIPSESANVEIGIFSDSILSKIEALRAEVDAIKSSSFSGKKVVTYGDSITELNLWQPYLAQELGVNIVNLGIGGTRVCKYAFNNYEYANSFSTPSRIANIPQDADYIIIMGGANDFGSPYPVIPTGKPVYDAENGVYLETNFVSAYCEVIRLIQTRCPSAKIILMPWCGGQMTSPNYPVYKVTVNSQPSSNGTIVINIDGTASSVNYTAGESIDSILTKLTAIHGTNQTTTKYNGSVYYKFDTTHQGTPSFSITGDIDILSSEKLESMPLRVNHIGYTPLDYRNGAEMAALLNNVYFIDLWQCGFNVYNRSLYISDTVHPNAIGGKKMAEFIIGHLKNIATI